MLGRAILRVAILQCFFVAGAQAQVFIDLGNLGEDHAAAQGINNSAQVVGNSLVTTHGDVRHAFIYDYQTGMMTDLGTLPQGGDIWPFRSWAQGINEFGTVVGHSNYEGCMEYEFHAFTYADGVMTDLGTLGGSSSAAIAINDHGAVVGASATGTENHAFKYTDAGGMVDLGILPPGEWSLARDINESGVIVGAVSLEPGLTPYIHACLWPDDDAPVIDLGTLGGLQSSAWAINDSGVVVGESHITGDDSYHAFRWTAGGGMEDLGVLEDGASGFAYDINDSGVIVGKQWLPSLQRDHATMYQGGVWVDLQATYFPEDRWIASWATAINDAGWIVGAAVDAGSQHEHAWLLIPDASVPTVTEWGMVVMTLLVLTAGSLVLARRRRLPCAAD